MGSGSNNHFDYTNNAFNKSGAFEVHKFNCFRHAPELNYKITRKFIEDLQAIQKNRARRNQALKLKILLASLMAAVFIVLALAY